MIRYETIRRLALVAVAAACTLLLPNAPAFADAGFEKWKKQFARTARRSGIKRATFDKAFAGISSFDPDVIQKARYQPEFRQRTWEYFDSRVDEVSVARGRELRVEYKALLDRLEAKYGVDRDILLGIWSMETRYGAILDQPNVVRPIMRSLATLAAKDRRRAKFARRQMLSAMSMLQKRQVKAQDLVGSWAGAMGHTQFIPTSYKLYRQNFDGKPGADIWNSVPDALATAANLLKRNGWRRGQTWGYEIVGTSRLWAQRNKSRTLAQWAGRGVERVAGRAMPRSRTRAVLKFPAGRNGPAFLMLKNFFVIKNYNNSDKYALAVGHLADQIGGGGDFVKGLPRPYPKLSRAERSELQKRLWQLGLMEKGKFSGAVGPKTRKGVMAAQKRFGMKQDGHVSPQLLARLRKET